MSPSAYLAAIHIYLIEMRFISCLCVRAAGGTVGGDALGGDFAALASLRVFLPPVFPSIRLTTAGIQTQLFTCVGTLMPKPTHSKLIQVLIPAGTYVFGPIE